MTIHHDHPTTTVPTPARRDRTGRRVPAWVLPAGLSVAAVAALTTAIAVNEQEEAAPASVDSATAVSSYQLVQESIDGALADHQAAAATAAGSYTLVQGSIDAALAELEEQVQNAYVPGSYTLVQGSIDAALAERAAQPKEASSSQLVQESIDAALAEQR